MAQEHYIGLHLIEKQKNNQPSKIATSIVYRPWYVFFQHFNHSSLLYHYVYIYTYVYF